MSDPSATHRRTSMLLQTLADPTRLAVVAFLSTTGMKTVGEIVKHLGISQPLCSHHLKALRKGKR